MSIKDWPASERPREKLLHLGPEALSSAELLAIVLHHGRVGETALDLARALLKRFDGLRGLLCASRDRACGEGFSRRALCRLQAAMEVPGAALEQTLERPDSRRARAARCFPVGARRDLPHEVFCCFTRDNPFIGGSLRRAFMAPSAARKRASARGGGRRRRTRGRRTSTTILAASLSRPMRIR
jgi:DNA repair protein RadC